MEQPKLEPMDVGQILATGLRLYLKNFWWFLGMSVLVSLPFAVVNCTFQAYGLTPAVGYAADWHPTLSYIPAALALQMVSTVVGFWLAIAVFAKVSAHYLNSPMGFWQAYKLIWPKFWTVVEVSVFFAVLFTVPSIIAKLPTMLEIEPGGVWTAVIAAAQMAVLILMLMVGIWLVVTPQCVAADNLSAWHAMKRSKALVMGNVWRVIGLFALLILIALGIYLICWPLDRPLLALWRFLFPKAPVVVSLKPTLVGTLFSSVLSVTSALLYYDLCARKARQDTEALEGPVGSGQTVFAKPRTSRLAIASLVLGVLAVVVGVCLSTAVPGVILGIAALIAIQSRKSRLTGQLKGRALAVAGVTISCLAMCLTYTGVLPLFFPPLRTAPCTPAEVLVPARLADLPSSATSVQAVQRLRGDSSGRQYLMFQATADDIETFIANSDSIADQTPTFFDSDNMYLPRKYRSRFRDREEWKEYSRHEHFRRRSYWPDWFDPTIKLKGRRYEIPESSRRHHGYVVVNDQTNTAYVYLTW